MHPEFEIISESFMEEEDMSLQSQYDRLSTE